MCIRREMREKGRRSLALSPVSKPHTHITYMLRQCTSIAYLSSTIRTTRTVFYWASTFPCNNTQLVIDNAGYIYYVEARILGHQNNAKQFTMMQQICENGPLHFPEESVILAEYIYRNRHPTTALFTTQPINRKPQHPCNLPVGVVVYRSGR
jgi:hypothetical protein